MGEAHINIDEGPPCCSRVVKQGGASKHGSCVSPCFIKHLTLVPSWVYPRVEVEPRWLRGPRTHSCAPTPRPCRAQSETTQPNSCSLVPPHIESVSVVDGGGSGRSTSPDL